MIKIEQTTIEVNGKKANIINIADTNGLKYFKYSSLLANEHEGEKVPMYFAVNKPFVSKTKNCFLQIYTFNLYKYFNLLVLVDEDYNAIQ